MPSPGLRRSSSTPFAANGRSLPAGVAELHQTVAGLAAQVESLERESAARRRDYEQLTGILGRLLERLGEFTRPLQAANQALLAATELLDQQARREEERRLELHARLAQQHQDNQRTAEALRGEQARLLESLRLVQESDRLLLDDAEARVGQIEETLQDWQAGLEAQFQALGQSVSRAAEQDAQATQRLAESGARTQAAQEESSRQLLGLNATLHELTEVTRESVARDQAQAHQANRAEAARLNRVALAHLARGNTEAALRLLAQASDLAPEAMEPRLNRAVALLQDRRFAEAAAQAEVLGNALPEDPAIAGVRGIARLALGDLARAHADLARAATAPMWRDQLSAATGLVHLLDGDARAARAAFGIAARRDSNGAAILREVGLTPEATGRRS